MEDAYRLLQYDMLKDAETRASHVAWKPFDQQILPVGRVGVVLLED